MKRSIALALALVFWSALTEASPLTVTAAAGSLQASASFVVVGGNLQITLTNTGAPALVPADVLTALFFNVIGTPSFTSLSAVLGSGSSVLNASQPAGGVVGGEWAVGQNLSGAPSSAGYGISSSGFGLFGGATFPGSNLQGPAAINGMQYGIVSSIAAGANAPLFANAFSSNAVVFTLGGVTSGFDPNSAISNISFQYGTSLTEPNISVPEPSTWLLLSSGIALVGYRTRRRKAK